jgi:hypothetical protein
MSLATKDEHQSKTSEDATSTKPEALCKEA